VYSSSEHIDPIPRQAHTQTTSALDKEKLMQALQHQEPLDKVNSCTDVAGNPKACLLDILDKHTARGVEVDARRGQELCSRGEGWKTYVDLNTASVKLCDGLILTATPTVAQDDVWTPSVSGTSTTLIIAVLVYSGFQNWDDGSDTMLLCLASVLLVTVSVKNIFSSLIQILTDSVIVFGVLYRTKVLGNRQQGGTLYFNVLLCAMGFISLLLSSRAGVLASGVKLWHSAVPRVISWPGFSQAANRIVMSSTALLSVRAICACRTLVPHAGDQVSGGGTAADRPLPFLVSEQVLCLDLIGGVLHGLVMLRDRDWVTASSLVISTAITGLSIIYLRAAARRNLEWQKSGQSRDLVFPLPIQNQLLEPSQTAAFGIYGTPFLLPVMLAVAVSQGRGIVEFTSVAAECFAAAAACIHTAECYRFRSLESRRIGDQRPSKKYGPAEMVQRAGKGPIR
jgi:hypothetical protein